MGAVLAIDSIVVIEVGSFWEAGVNFLDLFHWVKTFYEPIVYDDNVDIGENDYLWLEKEEEVIVSETSFRRGLFQM